MQTKKKMLDISKFIYNSRTDTAHIRDLLLLPTGSPVITFFQMKEIQGKFKSFCSKSPILAAIPPSFYPASARYLASTAVSISKRLFVVRRPLPILERVVAGSYLHGILEKLLFLKYSKRKIIDITLHFFSRIRFEEYYPSANRLDNVKIEETIRMPGIVRHGYSLWYTLIPVFITAIGGFKTYSEIILNPDVLDAIKSSIIEWSELNIIQASDMFERIIDYINGVENRNPDMTELDKLRIEASKNIISRLVIASLTVCVLLSASYFTGNDFLVEYSL